MVLKLIVLYFSCNFYAIIKGDKHSIRMLFYLDQSSNACVCFFFFNRVFSDFHETLITVWVGLCFISLMFCQSTYVFLRGTRRGEGLLFSNWTVQSVGWASPLVAACP